MTSGASFLVTMLALAAAVLGSAGARAADTCIEDWSTAAPVVKAEGLATVEAVTKLAAARVKGDVVKVTLCQDGNRYVYRLVVRDAGGKHTRLTVDAKEPFGR